MEKLEEYKKGFKDSAVPKLRRGEATGRSSLTFSEGIVLTSISSPYTLSKVRLIMTCDLTGCNRPVGLLYSSRSPLVEGFGR